jgi:hypothetical protein
MCFWCSLRIHNSGKALSKHLPVLITSTLATCVEQALTAIEPLRFRLERHRDQLELDRQRTTEGFAASRALMDRSFQEVKDRVDARLRQISEEYGRGWTASVAALDARLHDVRNVALELDKVVAPVAAYVRPPTVAAAAAASPTTPPTTVGDGACGGVPGGVPLGLLLAASSSLPPSVPAPAAILGPAAPASAPAPALAPAPPVGLAL